MKTLKLNGLVDHKKTNGIVPVQPFATYGSGNRKWIRYKLNPVHLMHHSSNTECQLYSLETFRKNCMLVCLREGEHLAPLPLRYFHRKQPIDLHYSWIGRTITINWSGLFYLSRGLSLHFEIIRFPRGCMPDLPNINAVSEWINNQEY